MKLKYTVWDEETGGEGTSGGNAEVLSMAEELSNELFPETKEDADGKELNADESSEDSTDESADSSAEPESATSTEKPTEDPAATAPAIRLPKGWKQEALDKFATLDPEIQAEVLQREDDFFKGIEQYKQAAQYAKVVQDMLKPMEPLFQARGLNPLTHLQSVIEADRQIASAQTPEQKVELFRQLAHYYGVQIDDSLFHAEDSTVGVLRNEINGLKTAWQSQAELVQKQELEKINNEIQTFINDPANKHFNALQHDIARLLETGACKTLKQAYDTALWSNPIVRQQVLDEQAKEKSAAEEAEKKKLLEESKKRSSVNIKSTNVKPIGKRSIEDTLEAAFDEIQARGN